jgi:archaellum biogenesis protein FlaJ (TadC family)
MQHVGRATTALLLATAIAIVGVTVVVMKRPLQRQWYEWRFQDEDLEDRHRVAVRLVDLGGEETVST